MLQHQQNLNTLATYFLYIYIFFSFFGVFDQFKKSLQQFQSKKSNFIFMITIIKLCTLILLIKKMQALKCPNSCINWKKIYIHLIPFFLKHVCRVAEFISSNCTSSNMYLFQLDQIKRKDSRLNTTEVQKERPQETSFNLCNKCAQKQPQPRNGHCGQTVTQIHLSVQQAAKFTSSCVKAHIRYNAYNIE